MGDRHNTRSGRICPTCHKKIKRTDSYAQPGDGALLYHFACYYPKPAENPDGSR